ncbi:MAG: ABC transporter ATP-binding protein [bacterium]|nr:ABC transporter ATP-binding protein [bacterium]
MAKDRDGPPLAALRGIGKTYHTDEVETHALADVSLDIFPGDFVAVAGPSGCGKSTLLAIMGLLEPPSSGEYQFGDDDVSNLSATERARIRNRQIGFVFQSFNLIGDLTVRENVEVPLLYRPGASRSRAEAVERVLERVGMTHRMKHYPGQLSGGQQQRVAVARALVGNPAILLADEPTGNLDSANGEAVMDLLGEIHGDGGTICMVTHDPRYIEFAQRKVYLFDGSVADSPPPLDARGAEELSGAASV